MAEKAESEFEGSDGQVQREPHQVKANEKLFLMKMTGQDPENITDQTKKPNLRSWRGHSE